MIIFFFLAYRNSSRPVDHKNSTRTNNWHVNHNQFSRNDQNINGNNNGDRYSRQQNNSYRNNSAYPNYGTQFTSGQQGIGRNDRPGYFTAGYQANNSQ